MTDHERRKSRRRSDPREEDPVVEVLSNVYGQGDRLCHDLQRPRSS